MSKPIALIFLSKSSLINSYAMLVDVVSGAEARSKIEGRHTVRNLTGIGVVFN